MSENNLKNLQLNFFFNNVKLKKHYINKLKDKISVLKTRKPMDQVDFLNANNQRYSTVSYVMYLSQKRTDTLLYITDPFGNIKYSLSARSVGFKGKAKRKARFLILKKLLGVLVSSEMWLFLKNKPITLHLKNVGFAKRRLVSMIKKKIFIDSTEFFYSYPFNGCRQKKAKRKKIRIKKN
jgi:ribosomal protein S11